MTLDPIAIERHRAFGAAQAEHHFQSFPSAKFTVATVLDAFRESMSPTAADLGFGTASLEPYVRSAALGFLRRWRSLTRTARLN